MERNRWETAIRCLEIAVHPNTSDEEAIAAVRGFRRTARNLSMSQLSRSLAAGGPTHLLDRIDQVNQENRELRRRIAEAETSRGELLGRLKGAEQRARDIGRELLAAEQRAADAEQRLVELRGAYGRISGGLHHENLDLRRALDDARRNLAQPIHEPVVPFRNVLDAAIGQAEPGPPAPVAAGTRQPWTA
jgi:septal ring factor EnvC (AmiA/AmiB activator)